MIFCGVMSVVNFLMNIFITFITMHRADKNRKMSMFTGVIMSVLAVVFSLGQTKRIIDTIKGK